MLMRIYLIILFKYIEIYFMNVNQRKKIDDSCSSCYEIMYTLLLPCITSTKRRHIAISQKFALSRKLAHL